MRTLPAKTPTESKLVTFEFSSEAAAGAVLSSPAIAKSVISGSDPAAASLTIGAVIATGTQAQALVSGGLDGVTYQLVCTVTANNGEVHQIIAGMAVNVIAA